MRKERFMIALSVLLLAGCGTSGTDETGTADQFAATTIEAVSTEWKTIEVTKETDNTEITTTEIIETTTTDETHAELGEHEVYYPIHPNKTVVVEDWYPGILLNSDENRKYPRVSIEEWYSAKDDVLYLPDTSRNGLDGYMKYKESEYEGDYVNEVSWKERYQRINGCSMNVPLSARGNNHIYVSDDGKNIVIDGREYYIEDKQIPCIWEDLYYVTASQISVFVVNIDEADEYVELIWALGSNEALVMRYDGEYLYQLAAIPSTSLRWNEEVGFALLSKCSTGLEVGWEYMPLEIKDGKLYRHPQGMYQLEKRTAQERDIEIQEEDLDLRTINDIALYASIDATETSILLKAQKIEQIAHTEQYLLLRGLEDGMEGWLRVEDIDMNDFKGYNTWD